MEFMDKITSAVALVSTGLNAAKSAVGLAKDVRESVDSAEPDLLALRQKVTDLQMEIITNKEAYLSVYDALLDLQRKAEQVQQFDLDAPRYVMTKTEQGSIIYSLRPECAEGEPLHDLCESCFSAKTKSVLQPKAHNTLVCPRCGSTAYKPDGRGSGIMVASSRRRDFDGFI